MTEQRAAEDAYVFLRGNTTGELRFDEHIEPLKYVIGPKGHVVAPVTHLMLSSQDTVLFVPNNADGAMELGVTLMGLDPDGPDGAVTDRWRIYHGDPASVQWAVLKIDAARYDRWVVDGQALRRPNPLAADEPAICRRINAQHRDALGRVCHHGAGIDVEQPLLVGVDPLGFDVRRRFDIARVSAPAPMNSPTDVDRTFSLLSSSPNG
jgi:hypothetical protein